MRATIRIKETKHGRLYTEVTRPDGTYQLILPAMSLFSTTTEAPRAHANVIPFRGKSWR